MRYRQGLMLVFLLLWGLSLSSEAAAAVYRWVDKKGQVHYTDDLSKIPAGALKEEKALPELSSGPALPPPKLPEAVNVPSLEGTQGGGGASASGASAQPQALRKILDGVQEKLREKLQEKDKLEAELKRPKYKEMVRSERQLTKELEKVKGEVEALKAEEERIKSEAARVQR